jgi:NAD(P)-dependent dehydrogenase (short-subunit alcohol dehydrogenase family)
MPRQNGRVFVVTGANSGLGFEASRALAASGASVVLASRSLERGAAAAEQIRQETPDAELHVLELDLADLASVRQFAIEFKARFDRLDVLLNNAGVMALPYHKTTDGFEMQFGTNHLGHFALTGLLMEMIVRTGDARVVTVSSGIHRVGRIDFDALDGDQRYSPWQAYARSKLANLLFAYELQRRLADHRLPLISVGCHPGFAATNLQFAGARRQGSAVGESISRVINRLFAASARDNVRSLLYAATSDEVNGCDYIGLDGFLGSRGYPVKERSSAASYDKTLAARLWEVSESLTGVRYDLEPATSHRTHMGR